MNAVGRSFAAPQFDVREWHSCAAASECKMATWRSKALVCAILASVWHTCRLKWALELLLLLGFRTTIVVHREPPRVLPSHGDGVARLGLFTSQQRTPGSIPPLSPTRPPSSLPRARCCQAAVLRTNVDRDRTLGSQEKSKDHSRGSSRRGVSRATPRLACDAEQDAHDSLRTSPASRASLQPGARASQP